MKQQIINLIFAQDYLKILDWAKELSSEDRYTSIEILMGLDPDEIIDEKKPKQYTERYYNKYDRAMSIKSYMLICSVRNFKDLSLTVPEWMSDKSNSVVHTYFSNPDFGVEPVIEYFKLFSPDYLAKIIEKNAKDRQSNNDFQLLWSLYKNGWVAFDEEIFVRSLFILSWSGRRKITEDISFLSKYPETIDKVLMQFYKYEIPVLDLVSWSAKDVASGGKCTNYWDAVFAELLKQEIIKDRSIVRNVLSTLTYNWKKGHLDWHIRLLKLFGATPEEYLANQDYLLAALSATSSSVCNFVIDVVKNLYKEEAFDSEAFLQNLPNLLVKEKSDKAILNGLVTANYLFNKHSKLRNYAETIAGALIQPNDKIQEAAARILKQYICNNDLKEVVIAFAPTLKKKAREILYIESEKIEIDKIHPIENYAIEYPANWEDFLFHIGKTINSLQPTDIDIMYNGFVQLHDQFPDNYAIQLKPFIKKAYNAFFDKVLLVYISEFFENWLSPSKKYKIIDPTFKKHEMNPIPFMRSRNKWVLACLKRRCKLPLLSTPTHYPFYVHPDILISRLSEYESVNEKVELEDLIIACNRILKSEITDRSRKGAAKLKGYYAKAIQYLLDVSDKISFDKETLPLWTQIARTKHTDGVFNEFTDSEAKDYPTVVQPLQLSYGISIRHSDDGLYHWDNLILQDNWTDVWHIEDKPKKYPSLFLYTGHNEYTFHSMPGFKYILTLVPYYLDGFILKHIPNTSSGNEVKEFEYCLYPLQFLLENQIQVHSSGWLYIAFCLIFEKKVSRTLAAEYINMSFDLEFIDKKYLSESIADMIMNKFAPINRLVEYFDGMCLNHIKEFQLEIIEKCIEKADKNNLPTNFKKLGTHYAELCSFLKQDAKLEITTKLNSLKK